MVVHIKNSANPKAKHDWKFETRVKSIKKTFDTMGEYGIWDNTHYHDSHTIVRHIETTQEECDARVIRGEVSGGTYFENADFARHCYFEIMRRSEDEIIDWYTEHKGHAFDAKTDVVFPESKLEKLSDDTVSYFEGLRINAENGRLELARTQTIRCVWNSDYSSKLILKDMTMFPNLNAEDAKVIPCHDLANRIRNNPAYETLSPLNKAAIDESLRKEHRGYMQYRPYERKYYTDTGKLKEWPECIELRSKTHDPEAQQLLRIRLNPDTHEVTSTLDCVYPGTTKFNRTTNQSMYRQIMRMQSQHDGFKQGAPADILRYPESFEAFKRRYPDVAKTVTRLLNDIAKADPLAVIPMRRNTRVKSQVQSTTTDNIPTVER